MKYIVFFIVLVFVINTNSDGQNVKPMLSIPSPNATSLGQYGEANISLFTGTHNVNIPLYELKEGNIKVPISLSYNASGVRPDQHPGWVGMNWSLNAGGMITRKVNGLPDEFYWKEQISCSDGSVWNRSYALGSNYHKNDLDATDWNTFSKVDGLARKNGWYETEPDEFIFNFGGISGKFYYNKLLNYVVVSDPSIQVQVDATLMEIGYPNYVINNLLGNINGLFYESEYKIKGFRVTTPDGTNYEFGLWNRSQTIDNVPIEASVDFFQEMYLNETWDTWYLVSIVSPEGNKVDFQYELGDPIVSFGRTTAMNKMQGSTTPSGILGIFGPVSSSSYNLSTRYDGKIIYPVYLKKISALNQEIVFNASTTNELKYNYQSITNDLFWQARETYRGDVWSSFVDNANYLRSARWLFSSRWAIHPEGYMPYQMINSLVSDYWNSYLLPNCNNVTNINFAYSQNGLNYYRMPYYMAAPELYACFNPSNNIGIIARKDIPSIYPGYYDCEIIDYNKLKWKQLDRFEVRNKQSQELIKVINLKYSSNSTERLSLHKVFEESCNGQYLPAYTFEYENYDNPLTSEGVSHQQDGNTEQLPVYLSDKVDHWGFSNGKQANYSSWSQYSDYRNPDKMYAYAGMLNKVSYPTGGYTKYFYEPHKYKSVVTRNSSTGEFSLVTNTTATETGGVRVRRIENYNTNGLLQISKDFQYGNGGILVGEHKYYWQNYQGKLITGATYTADRFITQSILPVSSNGAGSHIGYSKVVEIQNGNGSNEYYFSNFATEDNPSQWEIKDDNFEVTIDPVKSPYSPFSGKDIERGKLKEVKVFNNNGVLIHNEKNIYSPINNNSFLRAIATKQIPILGGIAVEGTAYKIYTYPYVLTEKKIIDYDINGLNPITKISTNKYNPLKLLSSEEITQGDGSIIKTVYRYLKDVFTYNGQPYNEIYRAFAIMDSKNMISNPIETLTYKDDKVIASNVLSFKEFPLFSNNIHPNISFELETKDPIDSSSYIISNVNNPHAPILMDPNLKPKIYFDDYDDKGNLLQFHKLNDVLTSFVWGYNKTQPTAVVKNAKSEEIYYNGYEEGANLYTADSHTGKSCVSINTNSMYAEDFIFSKNSLTSGKYVYSAWFKTSGTAALVVKDKIDQIPWIPRGVSNTNGEWKYFELVVDINSSDFNGCSQVGIEIFNNTTTPCLVDDVCFRPLNAQMTTYTYNSLVGMTSQTDPNRVTTYYEYDSFGRLWRIKDDQKNVLKQYDYHYVTPQP